MSYKIKSVNVEGIRGFNKPEAVTINEGVTLFYGPNGSGKSSLLQSIEWAMTGDIPNMKGGDFTREDAIVNLFNKSKKALVEINLQNPTSGLVLKRTRKMSTRTASGKQPLELKAGGLSFTDEEAESELEKLLKVKMEAFSQTKYLHQETIREILHAKPEERSQAIDKLLGTFEVREFAKALDFDRQIRGSTTLLQETVDALKRDKIQFLLNLKRSVEETKTFLISKGYEAQELTLLATLRKLEKSKNEVKQLNELYGKSQGALLDLKPDSQSLTDANRTLLNQLNDLDRARLEAINRLNNQKVKLKSDSTRYDDLFNQFQGMKQVDAAAITERVKAIEVELKNTDSKIKDVRQKLTSFPHKRSIYQNAKEKLELENSKLKAIRAEYGLIEEIQQKIALGENEVKAVQKDLDKLSGQQHLITLAIDHLETTKTQECPVCSKSIDNEQLTIALKEKVSDEISKSILGLREADKKIKANRKVLEGAIEESNSLLRTIIACETSLKAASEEIQKVVPNFETTNLDDIMKNWENEIEGLSRIESEFRAEQSKLVDVLTRFSQIQNEMRTLQAALQKVTSSAAEGSALSKKIDEVIRELDVEISKYSDSLVIDSLRKTLSDLADVLNLLRDDERVTAAEKELPLVEKQIKDLEDRSSRLQALASSLQSIRQMAVVFEQEASIAQLKRLEDAINLYYSKIQGHPHFARLKIDIEKEDPLIFSIRAASKQEDTYIPTRFSTAQLNSVALSIFMSYSTQQADDFPLMIFDDPTQNMDVTHKESFAKLVATLPPTYQVIIATEDDDTRRFLEKYCTGIKTYELGNWTPEGTEVKAA